MRNVMVTWIVLAAAVPAVFWLAGCGTGGGSDGPAPVARLEGAWLGSSFLEGRFEVTFDRGGKITRFLQNDTPTGTGGTSTHVFGPVFGVDVEMVGGGTSTWRLVLAEGDTHAALIRSDGQDVAVLERGATTHTLFADADFASRRFAGKAVAFDPAGGLTAFEDSELDIDASLLYKGTVGALAFSADGRAFDLVWPLDTDGEGGYADSDPLLRGDKLMLVMSPDGAFVAGVVFDFMRGTDPYATVRFLAAWKDSGP